MRDPLGAAILDYQKKPSKKAEIIVHSKICEDDVIPVPYLFRRYADFPELEKIAVGECSGKILDVGAGAGVHALYLKEQGKDVCAIDISEGAVSYMKAQGIDARLADFYELQGEHYDTILMLMNGIGIAGTLSSLENTLLKAYQLLNEKGQVIVDSSDIIYLYEDEEGGLWMDLNTEYYGNFDYQMEYNGITGEWFPWLYVDFDKMKAAAEKVGFKVELLFEEDYQYLVKLIK
ncbi:MAG: class I SAM-dependent methyltransferase [Flavobacteriia bacterium]|nr:class I SAM-dependent methyltransferase [Flavobacteriia bacterium]OJX39121.1 MAG: hypothetical protein BGO87_03820 [Flavobacteriia bacterium 40-80]